MFALIGFFLGMLLTKKLVGAIAFAIVGFLVQRSFLPLQRPSAEALQQAQNLFFETLFRLLGHLAKSDGHISEVEIKLTEAYMDKMGLTPEHRRQAIALFKQGAAPEFNLQDCLNLFVPLAKRSPNLSQMLLVYLINLASIDGEISAQETHLLQRVAESLGFSRLAFEQLLRMVGAQNSFQQGAYHGYSSRGAATQSDLQKAYDAMGADASISDADLKKAYRKLMSQYHPDKLIGQGLPDDMVKEATERSQEIQAAYDIIKKSRT